jgi:hypothetical protein
MHRLFGSNRPGVMLLLVIPAAVTAVAAGLWFEPGYAPGGSLYRAMARPLEGMAWLQLLCGTLVLGLCAVLVNIVFNRYEYSNREHYLPSLVFILFCVSLPEAFYFNPVCLGLFFVLLSLRRLLGVYRLSNANRAIFESGMLFSLGALCFPLFVYMYPLLWIGLFRLRTFNGREWLLPLVGALVPWVYVLVVPWLMDSSGPWEQYFFREFAYVLLDDLRGQMLLFWLLTFVVVAVGLYQFIADMGISTVHRQNTKALFIWSASLLAVVVLIVWVQGRALPAVAQVFRQLPSMGALASGLPVLLAPVVAVFGGVAFSGSKRVAWVKAAFYTWVAKALLVAIWRVAAQI